MFAEKPDLSVEVNLSGLAAPAISSLKRRLRPYAPCPPRRCLSSLGRTCGEAPCQQSGKFVASWWRRAAASASLASGAAWFTEGAAARTVAPHKVMGTVRSATPGQLRNEDLGGSSLPESLELRTRAPIVTNRQSTRRRLRQGGRPQLVQFPVVSCLCRDWRVVAPCSAIILVDARSCMCCSTSKWYYVL